MQRRARQGKSKSVRRSRLRPAHAKTKRAADPAHVFGRNLQRICRAREISAAMLADRIGKSAKAVERMLAGKTDPSLSLLKSIGRAIGAPIQQLVRGL